MSHGGVSQRPGFRLRHHQDEKEISVFSAARSLGRSWSNADPFSYFALPCVRALSWSLFFLDFQNLINRDVSQNLPKTTGPLDFDGADLATLP